MEGNLGSYFGIHKV